VILEFELRPVILSTYENMKIKLIAYGIAKDILQAREKDWEATGDLTIQTLKENLLAEYPAFSNLKKLSFAVGIEYRDDTFALKDGDEVVIIPPVSGG
jgi:molybdopterin converting factor small subunit